MNSRMSLVEALLPPGRYGQLRGGLRWTRPCRSSACILDSHELMLDRLDSWANAPSGRRPTILFRLSAECALGGFDFIVPALPSCTAERAPNELTVRGRPSPTLSCAHLADDLPTMPTYADCSKLDDPLRKAPRPIA